MTIEQVHSDYDVCYKRWKMAYDFYRGGRYVLEPDWSASKHHWVIERGNSYEDNISGDVDRNQSTYEWISASANSYLWKHPSERREEYEERHARAVHYPYFSQFVEIYVSGIFKSGQVRSNVNSSFDAYLKDVDLCGNNIDIFMRYMLAYSIVFGRCHAITDMPLYNGTLNSLEEQRNLGVRAYSKIITPLDLIDWDIDDRGNFNWVKIKEIKPVVRNFEDTQKDDQYQYRVLTRDGWHILGVDEKKQNYIIAEGEYPSRLKGSVPIATVWTAKEKSMACESPIASIVDGDRHIFNRKSEVDTIARLNGFAMLSVPNIEGAPVGPIDIGPGRAISYPAQAGSPSWLSSDPGVLQGLVAQINDEIHDLRVLAGVSRGAAEGSKELRSAAALSHESENRINQMAIWSTSTEQCEQAMLRHVAGWEGISESAVPSVQYQVNFMYRALSNQINDLNQLNATQSINDTARKALAKPIVHRMLQESGLKEEEISDVLKSIDEEPNFNQQGQQFLSVNQKIEEEEI